MAGGAAAGQTVFHLHVHIVPRKDGDTKGNAGPDAGGDKGEHLNLPDGVNMQLTTSGDVIARTEWLTSDPGYKVQKGHTHFPARSAEILRAFKSSGTIPWIEESRIPGYAAKLSFSATIKKSAKFTKLPTRFSIYAVVGPPPGSKMMWSREGRGLAVVIRASAISNRGPDPAHAEDAQRLPLQ